MRTPGRSRLVAMDLDPRILAAYDFANARCVRDLTERASRPPVQLHELAIEDIANILPEVLP
jgi:hypothetical protein